MPPRWAWLLTTVNALPSHHLSHTVPRGARFRAHWTEEEIRVSQSAGRGAEQREVPGQADATAWVFGHRTQNRETQREGEQGSRCPCVTPEKPAASSWESGTGRGLPEEARRPASSRDVHHSTLATASATAVALLLTFQGSARLCGRARPELRAPLASGTLSHRRWPLQPHSKFSAALTHWLAGRGHVTLRRSPRRRQSPAPPGGLMWRNPAENPHPGIRRPLPRGRSQLSGAFRLGVIGV